MKNWVFACAAAMLAPQICSAQTSEMIPVQVMSSPGNRFVFGQLSRMRADQFMLDTTAGRLWRLVCIKEDDANKSSCLSHGLEPILYFGDKGYVGNVPQYMLPAPK